MFAVSARPNRSTVLNWGGDCYDACDKKTGYCEAFCGAGNACCRFGDPFNAPQCHGILEWGSKDRYTCVVPALDEYQLSPPPLGGQVRNWGADCWSACGNLSGACPDFCGVGSACCSFRNVHDQLECQGIVQWGSKEHYTCVAP